tara:strand:- start:267 stop:416 length:150 start_codon:yes stop_codon:yes gene_type:complete
MNKREDILAEMNMIKILVWQLWEEAHGKIQNKDWDSLKVDVIKEMKKIT